MEGVSAASQQRLDFMTLLVEELRNQNPLEPMDHQQMAAQLAQFSQLEESEKMNTNLETINETIGNMDSSFQAAMYLAELDYARSLLAQEVSFYSDYYDQMLTGRVEEINYDSGLPSLAVQVTMVNEEGQNELREFAVALEEVSSIKNEQ
ncbi:MAG: hypothetical protein JXA82_04020 [Sedimentisphaerales bacterium]|nr:hypothetical protein [Sedimentisphaerales bacterium]